jgi:anti-sigma B factor antagonist
MKLTRTREDEVTHLMIAGEFDATTVSEVRSTFDEVVAEKPARVRLDLSALRLLDSSGVGAIVSLFKRVRAGGGQFEVANVRGQPLEIFRVLRLDRVFEIS